MVRSLKLLRLLPLFAFIAAPQLHADVLEDVLDRGELRVGLAEFAPWTMRDKDGGLIGFEVDLARKLAEDMGVDLELRLYPWDQIIDAVQAGEIDIIAGGMAITPERALQVNFTIPIATSGVGIVTNTEKTTDIQTLVDMNRDDIVIAVVAETLSENVARSLFPEASIRTFPNSDDAKRAVVTGSAHALVSNMPQARFVVLQNPDQVDLPLVDPILASKEGLAVKKGEQEFLNFLNAWVTARDTDRWIPSTHDYWFGTLEWLDQIEGE